MPLLLARLQDAIPRVLAWVLAAIRDLAENMTPEMLAPHLNAIMSHCMTCIRDGPWFVAEKAFQVCKLDVAFAEKSS